MFLFKRNIYYWNRPCLVNPISSTNPKNSVILLIYSLCYKTQQPSGIKNVFVSKSKLMSLSQLLGPLRQISVKHLRHDTASIFQTVETMIRIGAACFYWQCFCLPHLISQQEILNCLQVSSSLELFKSKFLGSAVCGVGTYNKKSLPHHEHYGMSNIAIFFICIV